MKPYRQSTWFHPALTTAASNIHGTGIFAETAIHSGEVVMIWGGDVYSRADLENGRIPADCSYSFIDDDVVMTGPEDGMDYFVNHSCDPNVWMADEVTIVARRDIRAGEEITGDYAVWESDPGVLVEQCACGSLACRGRVTGDDWMLPQLQSRYSGHFMPYIGRRFERTPRR